MVVVAAGRTHAACLRSSPCLAGVVAPPPSVSLRIMTIAARSHHHPWAPPSSCAPAGQVLRAHDEPQRGVIPVPWHLELVSQRRPSSWPRPGARSARARVPATARCLAQRAVHAARVAAWARSSGQAAGRCSLGQECVCTVWCVERLWKGGARRCSRSAKRWKVSGVDGWLWPGRGRAGVLLQQQRQEHRCTTSTCVGAKGR